MWKNKKYSILGHTNWDVSTSTQAFCTIRQLFAFLLPSHAELLYSFHTDDVVD